MVEKFAADRMVWAFVTLIVVLLVVATLMVSDLLSTKKEFIITVKKPGLLLLVSDSRPVVSGSPIIG